jgi:cysteinyl-tRNA synthetase
MSKSLGNFFTIKEVLGKFPAEVVRFFLINCHYRSPLDFSDAALAEAETALLRLYAPLAKITGYFKGAPRAQRPAAP